MPDTRTHDEVDCPDCGMQWVASQGVHSTGCRHLDLLKRPTEMDDDELLQLALWQADGGARRQAPSDSRPEPEPTRPEPEPPPQPTKPPEPEPPKPEAISEETLGTVERLGYRVGRGVAVVLLVAVVAVPVAVVWWLVARS
jgi:hypothetical protein